MMSSSSQSFIRNLLVLLALSVWIGTLFIQVEAAPIPVRRSGATGSSGSLPKRSNTPGLGNPFAPYRLIKKRQLAAASSSAAAASTSVLNLATQSVSVAAAAPSQTIASAAAPVASIAPPPNPLSPLLGAIPPSIASMAAGVLGKLLPSQAAALLPPPAGAGAGLVFSSVNIPNSAFAATTTAAVLTTPAAVSVSISVSVSTTTTTVFTTPPPPCSTALAVPPVISQPPVAVVSSQVASALPSGTTTFITIGDTPSSVAPLPSGTTTFITINAPPSSVAPLPSGTTTFITVAPPVVTAPPVASSSSLPSGTTTIITLGAQSGNAGPTLSMTSGAASTSCSSNLVFNKASLHTNPAQNAVFWKAIPDNADAVTALITNPNPPRNEAGDFSAVGAFYVTDTWQAAAQQACYGPAATANGASPVTQVAVIQYQWQPTSNLKIFEFESANTQWNAFIKTKNDPVISTVDLIAGPQTFTKDITTDFWQYALNSDAAMASLELAAVYQPVMCANIPRGNCLPLS